MADLTYFHPVKIPEAGVVLSCDSLRYTVKIHPRDFAGLVQWCDISAFSDDVRSFPPSLKIGGYRHMWTWPVGDSSVTFALGLNQNGVKESIGMLDFNPNKVGESHVVRSVLQHLVGLGARLILSRWDLACDIWQPRKNLVLLKDSRGYELHVKKAVTQYLGQRNKPGRVKLYDKGAELGLPDLGLTRLEITCDGSWDAANICGLWPHVLQLPAVYPDGSTMSPANRVMVAMLVDMMNAGLDVELYLRDMPRRTAYRVRQSLAALDFMEYPGHQVEQLCEIVRKMPSLLADPK